MNIKEVFKKYPENEPNYNGVNYLTLVNIDGNISYSITYFTNDAMFEPDYGKVVAFSQLDPKVVLNALNIVVVQSEQLPCDVCGSTDVITAPHMGQNCNKCNPLY